MQVPTLDDFSRLEKTVIELKDLIHTLLEIQGTPTIDAKEIARREGLSPNSIYNSKYRHYLPGYGISQYSEGRVRWDLSVYIAWRSKCPIQRKKTWENMSASSREKIVRNKKPVI